MEHSIESPRTVCECVCVVAHMGQNSQRDFSYSFFSKVLCLQQAQPFAQLNRQQFPPIVTVQQEKFNKVIHEELKSVYTGVSNVKKQDHF